MHSLFSLWVWWLVNILTVNSIVKRLNLYHKVRCVSVCHSFHITVIPSGLLSFPPDYCHSFQKLSFRELQILTSSKSFPYPKGEKNGNQRWPYLRVKYNIFSFSKILVTCKPTKLSPGCSLIIICGNIGRRYTNNCNDAKR
jgi:hypothetical protein